ncbi:hypothetical protein SAMN05444374_102119 [Rhodococcoides kroppenstedtii]|uniref:AEC family transporter n=1 Tax=Rhodococcoides kroppenstedtii TaxID=293050 RepID=A0A1I0SQM4_9NOCA|nr:AEC family transporter [Rhodococcus kroppenstedtii]SFA41723.1 hypothetical protein SAMN05444374_102119 [Rhodococcus kroppenstedtii]
MHLVTSAVLPIVAILLAGAVIRRRVLDSDDFWRGLEWLSFHVFTPALFVHAIANSPVIGTDPLPLIVGLTAPVLAVSAVLLVVRAPLRVDGPRLTSMVQGCVRLNTYIGLVFAEELGGTAGVAMFAVASAVMVPLVNVVSVGALTRFGRMPGDGPRPSLVRSLWSNPLIIACAIGLTLSLTGTALPEVLARPIDLLSQPALVTGTLAAGAALSFGLRWRDVADLVATSAVKLVALPVMAYAVASALGATSAVLTAVVLITALPTAPSAYVLARRMGGDHRLMSAITGAQTVLAMITLPIVVQLTVP